MYQHGILCINSNIALYLHYFTATHTCTRSVGEFCCHLVGFNLAIIGKLTGLQNTTYLYHITISSEQELEITYFSNEGPLLKTHWICTHVYVHLTIEYTYTLYVQVVFTCIHVPLHVCAHRCMYMSMSSVEKGLLLK